MTRSAKSLLQAPASPLRSCPPRPARIRYLPPKGDFAPIAQINTTPLVDVMLVLLIMFIMIVPVASHKVPIDLPGGPPQPGVPAPIHRLDITAGGALRWDGAALPTASLPARLGALTADPARPVLHLNAHGEARYERVDQVLAQIRGAGVTRMGFVDNRQFARAF